MSPPPLNDLSHSVLSKETQFNDTGVRSFANLNDLYVQRMCVR